MPLAVGDIAAAGVEWAPAVVSVRVAVGTGGAR
jgi:hypothetical protein